MQTAVKDQDAAQQTTPGWSIVPGNTASRCQHCKLRCMDGDQLKEHLLTHKRGKRKCNECGKIFNTASDFKPSSILYGGTVAPCRLIVVVSHPITAQSEYHDSTNPQHASYQDPITAQSEYHDSPNPQHASYQNTENLSNRLTLPKVPGSI
ncbi:hypothetical protein WMY93_009288 [Mugilogobius chulae]|uniref:C2H2-type domain-containing protein n=1 Tax=Mugilogobius chulae TaxID=88201 RepID=A0AAW0PCF8_9GOBI